MNNFICVHFSINPYSQDAADLLAAFLADIGFDSFIESESGMDAFVECNLFNESSLNEIIEDFPIQVDLQYSIEEIEKRDWNEEWEKNYFQPLVLAEGKCVIHASFHTGFPEAQYEIIIDPKMAFGTGNHATTSMMINHLFEIPLNGKKLMDMGTGTGILAILANKLGAQTEGIEIDEGAYQNAKENIRLNNAYVKILNGDATALPSKEEYDVFLANINRNIILADLDRYVQTIKPGGFLVLSGFLNADIKLISSALISCDFKIDKIETVDGDWSSIRAIKNF